MILPPIKEIITKMETKQHPEENLSVEKKLILNGNTVGEVPLREKSKHTSGRGGWIFQTKVEDNKIKKKHRGNQ